MLPCKQLKVSIVRFRANLRNASQCSTEQVQRTHASVMVAAKCFLSLRNVLSHRSHSAGVICKNVLEIRSNFAKFGKNSWPSCQLYY